jgi:hypothetical protein
MSTAVQEPIQPAELGAVAGYGKKNESMEEIEGAYIHLRNDEIADIDSISPTITTSFITTNTYQSL